MFELKRKNLRKLKIEKKTKAAFYLFLLL